MIWKSKNIQGSAYVFEQLLEAPVWPGLKFSDFSLFLSWNYLWKNAWKLFLLYKSTCGLHHSLQSLLDIFKNVSQVLIFIEVSHIFFLLFLIILGVLWSKAIQKWCIINWFHLMILFCYTKLSKSFEILQNWF